MARSLTTACHFGLIWVRVIPLITRTKVKISLYSLLQKKPHFFLGAVITGGASGIGLAAAKRCLSLGMRVVICDVNSTSLNRAVAELREQNRHVLGVKVDVSKLEDNEVMLERAKSFLGPNNIAFVFLNAGISDEPGCAWESNPKELKKSMG